MPTASSLPGSTKVSANLALCGQSSVLSAPCFEAPCHTMDNLPSQWAGLQPQNWQKGAPKAGCGARQWRQQFVPTPPRAELWSGRSEAWPPLYGPRAGCRPHYHLRGSLQPCTVETHIPISHRRKLRLMGPGALPSTVELGVQHRPSVPDSGAVSLHQGKWPGSHGPRGCRSTSWPLVGGQVSPNLGLAGSYLQGRLTAGRRLHKLLWLPAWGSALFPLPGNSHSPWGPPRCFPGGPGTLC